MEVLGLEIVGRCVLEDEVAAPDEADELEGGESATELVDRHLLIDARLMRPPLRRQRLAHRLRDALKRDHAGEIAQAADQTTCDDDSSI